jgi:hypothetical protein
VVDTSALWQRPARKKGFPGWKGNTLSLPLLKLCVSFV